MKRVGEVNAHNTLHQTKALLQAECLRHPFMLLYFPRKENVREKVKYQFKTKKEQKKKKRTSLKRASRRVTRAPSTCFASTAMLKSFAFEKVGLLMGMRGLKAGCCGNTTVHLLFCLDNRSIPLSPKSPRNPQNRRLRIKKNESRTGEANWFLKKCISKKV